MVRTQVNNMVLNFGLYVVDYRLEKGTFYFFESSFASESALAHDWWTPAVLNYVTKNLSENHPASRARGPSEEFSIGAKNLSENL